MIRDDDSERIVNEDKTEVGDFQGNSPLMAALFGAPSPERRQLEMDSLRARLRQVTVAADRAQAVNRMLDVAAFLLLMATLAAVVLGMSWTAHELIVQWR